MEQEASAVIVMSNLCFLGTFGFVVLFLELIH